MRLVIDLRTDPAGRPKGAVQSERPNPEPFCDWLELLRVLEGCVDRTHQMTTEADGNRATP